MTKLTPIKFAAIYEAGRSHPPLLGQFVRDQLVLVRLADGAMEWRRAPGESPAQLEARITAVLADLFDVRC